MKNIFLAVLISIPASVYCWADSEKTHRPTFDEVEASMNILNNLVATLKESAEAKSLEQAHNGSGKIDGTKILNESGAAVSMEEGAGNSGKVLDTAAAKTVALKASVPSPAASKDNSAKESEKDVTYGFLLGLMTALAGLNMAGLLTLGITSPLVLIGAAAEVVLGLAMYLMCK